jgi:hypothetical protein
MPAIVIRRQNTLRIAAIKRQNTLNIIAAINHQQALRVDAINHQRALRVEAINHQRALMVADSLCKKEDISIKCDYVPAVTDNIELEEAEIILSKLK